MLPFLSPVLLFIFMQSQLIFDFKNGADISAWKVVDDVVMGGKSSGNFEVNAEGNGVFYGTVSLENNGGFSSLQYSFKRLKTEGFNCFSIRLKGDGKTYQMRVKSKSGQYYSFVCNFTTTGNWQNIIIPFNSMYPSWRGNKLKFGNFPGEIMEEIGILIANKKPESFKLEIDKIELKQG